MLTRSEVMELIGMMREHPEIPDEWPEDLKAFLEKCFEVSWLLCHRKSDLLIEQSPMM